MWVFIKVPLSFARFEVFRFTLLEICNVKCNGSPSSRSTVFPCERTDMTKLKFAFRKCFANARGALRTENQKLLIIIRR